MSNIKKRAEFLQKELPNITAFLNEFEYSKSSIKPKIVVGGNWEYLRIDNFPLPDKYSPDYEDIGIVTLDYPDFGPAGIHLYNSSPNLSRIRTDIGHVIPDPSTLPDQNYQTYVDAMPGWTWICFHYSGWRWNFNPNNMMLGDTIHKYIISLYSLLDGKFYD